MKKKITGRMVEDIRTTQLKMTVEDFAKMLKISTKTVERWESKPKDKVNTGGAAGHKLEEIFSIVNDPKARAAFIEAVSFSAPMGAIVGGALLGPLGTLAGLGSGLIGIATAKAVKQSLLRYLESNGEPDS